MLAPEGSAASWRQHYPPVPVCAFGSNHNGSVFRDSVPLWKE